MGIDPASLEPFRIGIYTDPDGGTGLTVILIPEGAVGIADIQGRSPGTREIGLLRLESSPRIYALVLTGGSAWGLGACEGVVQFLKEEGVGHPTPYARIPLVAGAVLFDLNIGEQVYPSPENAYLAARRALPQPPPEGNEGAGTGATVGKWAGLPYAMKGGQGFSWIQIPENGWMGVLAVVNAVGDVMAPNGTVLAGARDSQGFLRNRGFRTIQPRGSPSNTTHLVAFGNIGLSRLQASLLARRLHHAMIRTLRPVHTRWDGDISFVLTSHETPMDDMMFESFSEMLLDAAEDAIRRAIRKAKTLHGFPALIDLAS